MQSDLRKSMRFIPEKNSFAALGTGIMLVGKISDISSSGLAFEHIANLNSTHVDPGTVDIFVSGMQFHLADVPCVKVYDLPINTGNIFTSPFLSKRCGVKFTTLNNKQMIELEAFLEKHTTGLA